MRKQLLLLLFSLFAVMGYARTVTGVVTSEADKQPVIGATVMVQGTERQPILTENTQSTRVTTMSSCSAMSEWRPLT